MRPSIDSAAPDKVGRPVEQPKNRATTSDYSSMVTKPNNPVIASKNHLRGGVEPNSDIKECLV